MKATHRLITATLFAVVGAGAFAQEATPDAWIDSSAASKSRAQVRHELVDARADGSIRSGSIDYDFVRHAKTMKTREQVRSEVVVARASGEYAMLNSEAYSFGGLPRTPAYASQASGAAQ